MSMRLVIAMLMGLHLMTCSPLLAADNDEQTWDNVGSEVQRSNDFVILLKAHELKRFLEYKGSKLFPVTAVDARVSVRDGNGQAFAPFKHYETFWFHNSVGVGVSREMQLKIPHSSQGAIVIEDTPEAQKETKSICNAIARLLLDAHILNSGLTVIAPDALCAQLASDLGNFRFHQIGTIRSNDQGILLHVKSKSQSFDKYFWFAH